MRQIGRVFVVTLACLAAGCIASTTVVKLKTDGSGTIEQSVSMKKEAADQLQMMMAGFGGSDAAKDQKTGKPMELFSEQQMRDAAAKLGPGVTYVSSKPITEPGRLGRVALYKFADITKLSLDQKPVAPGPAGAMEKKGPAENITFGFAKLPNGHSQLTINFPEPKLKPGEGKSPAAKDATPKKSAQKPTAEQIEMMKKLFDGLKVDLTLEAGSTIVKTNSPYVDGNRVTLLQIDFSQLLKDQDKLAELGEPSSIEEAKAALKNLQGVKVNLDRQLVVEFSGK